MVIFYTHDSTIYPCYSHFKESYKIPLIASYKPRGLVLHSWWQIYQSQLILGFFPSSFQRKWEYSYKHDPLILFSYELDSKPLSSHSISSSKVEVMCLKRWLLAILCNYVVGTATRILNWRNYALCLFIVQQ